MCIYLHRFSLVYCFSFQVRAQVSREQLKQAHWITKAIRINMHFLPCKSKYLDAQLVKWNYLQCAQMKLTGLNFPLFSSWREWKRRLSTLLCVWRKRVLWHWLISSVRTGQTLHKQSQVLTVFRRLPLITVWMFSPQQLSGEENSGRKHSASLQRPSSQARVSKTPAQSESSPAHRCHF